MIIRGIVACSVATMSMSTMASSRRMGERNRPSRCSPLLRRSEPDEGGLGEGGADERR